MAAIDDLNAAVTGLQQEDAAFRSAVTSALSDLTAEVEALKNAGVDTAAIEAAVGKINDVVTAEQGAATAAQQADPGPQTPAPATVALDPASKLPLYSFSGADPSTIDTTQWTQVTDVTNAGAPLYTFAGDTAGSSTTNGAGPAWTPFTGTPTPTA